MRITKDDDLVALLKAIKHQAMSCYPVPDSAENLDPVLLVALGMIAGMAYRALNDHEERRSDHRVETPLQTHEG